MTNFKLKIEFDGTRYYGWERQPNKDTIQGKLEDVLAKMCPEMDPKPEVIGAGRTDAGVHARAMIANVHLETNMDAIKIRDYMNKFLPDDIAVIAVRSVSDRFHARYNAKRRSYKYTIFDGPVKPVFNRKYYTRLDVALNKPGSTEDVLDVDLMNEGAKYLLGEHDFKSFCGNPHMKKSTVRTIDELTIRRSKGYVYVDISADGFLQHMVRIIVGTLIDVGLQKIPPEKVKEILETKDRKAASPTAPADGLALVSVEY